MEQCSIQEFGFGKRGSRIRKRSGWNVIRSLDLGLSKQKGLLI